MEFLERKRYSHSMALPFRFSLSLTSSAVLHILLFGGVILLGQSKNSFPSGVNRKGSATLIEVSLSTPPPAKESSSFAASSVPRQVKPAAKAPTPAQMLGSQNGVQSTQELGTEDGISATEKQRYVYELRTLIEGRKTYPSLSQRLGERGRVTVQFQVFKDGHIDKVQLKEKSSYARLDEAAVNLIKQISSYKPFPRSIAAESLTLEVPLDYQIN